MRHRRGADVAYTRNEVNASSFNTSDPFNEWRRYLKMESINVDATSFNWHGKTRIEKILQKGKYLCYFFFRGQELSNLAC